MNTIFVVKNPVEISVYEWVVEGDEMQIIGELLGWMRTVKVGEFKITRQYGGDLFVSLEQRTKIPQH